MGGIVIRTSHALFGIAGFWVGCVTLSLTLLGDSTDAWVQGPGFRYRTVAVLPDSRSGPGFQALDPTLTGLTFTNVLSRDRLLRSQILPNGSGVTAGDIDGDGLVDLYFCGLDSDNRLFRNLGGWQFEDITQAAGVECRGLDSTGAVFSDLDGDGDLDLVVNSIGGGTRLFFNDGRGRFTLQQPLLNPDRGGTTAALADVDGDGDLDLYVANYRRDTFMDRPNPRWNIRIVDQQPVVSFVDGRPLTAPDLTNRFTFNITMADGLGKF